MKTAILYFSLHGNTETAAKAMAEAVGADLIKVELTKPVPKAFILQIFSCGFAAKFKKKKPIQPFTFTPAQYDLIILGSPTWAGSLTPPMRTAISKFDFSGRNVALFSTSAGPESEAITQMKEILPGASIAGECSGMSPKKNEESLEKLVNWAKSLVK